MKGYTVHLFCHVLALLLGGACGAAAGFWLFAGNDAARWVFVGTLLAGLAVPGLQLVYLAADRDRPRGHTDTAVRSTPRIDVHSPGQRAELERTRAYRYPEPGGRSGTRPDLEPVDEPRADDADTSVMGAERRGRTDPPTRRW